MEKKLEDRTPANKTFFELLKKHTVEWEKDDEKQDTQFTHLDAFRSAWNDWVKTEDNGTITLDFSRVSFKLKDRQWRLFFHTKTKDPCFNFSSFFFGDSNFNGATFKEDAYFSGAIFTKEASFSHAVFNGHANFSQAMFNGCVHFIDAMFNKSPNFSKATFTENVNFFNATFIGGCSFRQATFEKDLNLNEISKKDLSKDIILDFTNASFKGRFNLENSKNIGRIVFKNASLYELFVLDSEVMTLVDFSDTHIEKTAVIKDRDSWLEKLDYNEQDEHALRWLKNYYKSKNDYEREMIYFRHEMKCKLKREKWRHKVFLGLYGFISSYGTSYIRPLVALLMLSGVHYLVLRLFPGDFNSRAIFPFLSIGDGIKPHEIPVSLISICFWFLFALGVKTKFKLK